MEKRKFLLITFNGLMIFLVAFGISGLLQGRVQAQELEPGETPERQPTFNSAPDLLSPETINPATATQLADAMGVPSGDLISADLMGSDSNGVGVSDSSLGTWFPTQGDSFAILSTGMAADASLPNNSGSHSSELIGLNNNLGEDLVRLHLGLHVPAAFNCLNFDFAFYSEEFPEFVGTEFNDTFTAQLNNSNLSVDGQTNIVNAPGNFAFDTQQNIISVNTVFGVLPDTGTTYDGSTPSLRASTSVTPDSNVDIYLSVQDLGDSIYDSSVFLDRFFWSTDETCVGGASVDTDGDGLLDDWETDGLTIDGKFVDLPAMGADPLHKDIFVEADWMGDPGDGHDHSPDPDAIQEIVDAFDNAPVSNPDVSTGIHLHVDYGPTAPLNWGTAATWGLLSDGDMLAHQTNISTCSGTTLNWSGFDTIKNANFNEERESVFHYNIWGHSMCSTKSGTSGISRNGGGGTFGDGASDFIVSLGGWSGMTGTEDQQAGTFMHEFGHNLGLRHGGEDHTQWKPNYLSVMNYSFQTRGLMINSTQGHFDYSRYDLADLRENSLNEADGINIPGGVTDTLGTRYFCGQDNMQVVWDASQADWNCDGDATDSGISRNINQGVSWNNNSTLDTLTSQNDWINLVYVGGALGAPGADITLPTDSEVIDVDVEQDDDIVSIEQIFLPSVLR
ncbi:choice-of-anchor L domain-containing protein [Chloroflexota bacterium]